MSLIRASELDEQMRVRSLPLEASVEISGATAGAGGPGFAQDIEISRLRAALAASEEKRDQQVAAAREQGRRDASAAHKRDEAAYTAMLSDGIKASLTAFQTKIEELNLSAVMICENTLARLIGDGGKYSDLISAAVSQQLGRLQQEAIIAVYVSAADFPDQAGLGAIAKAVDVPQRLIAHDPSMASGSCRIELRLGTIDISLPEYWEALQASFAQLKLQARRP